MVQFARDLASLSIFGISLLHAKPMGHLAAGQSVHLPGLFCSKIGTCTYLVSICPLIPDKKDGALHIDSGSRQHVHPFSSWKSHEHGVFFKVTADRMNKTQQDSGLWLRLWKDLHGTGSKPRTAMQKTLGLQWVFGSQNPFCFALGKAAIWNLPRIQAAVYIAKSPLFQIFWSFLCGALCEGDPTSGMNW